MRRGKDTATVAIGYDPAKLIEFKMKCFTSKRITNDVHVPINNNIFKKSA